MTDGLTFNTLRGANMARLPQFKNSKGEPAHSQPDGSDWGLGDWVTAVTGELGEAANIIKKVKRGDLTLDEAKPELAREFADIVTYLDILAAQCGIDLGRATMDKFNEVSRRVKSSVRVAADDWYFVDILNGQ
jgi:NTP pyrophosphatase (non-canonical NTP hydrolase)